LLDELAVERTHRVSKRLSLSKGFESAHAARPGGASGTPERLRALQECLLRRTELARTKSEGLRLPL